MPAKRNFVPSIRERECRPEPTAILHTARARLRRAKSSWVRSSVEAEPEEAVPDVGSRTGRQADRTRRFTGPMALDARTQPSSGVQQVDQRGGYPDSSLLADDPRLPGARAAPVAGASRAAPRSGGVHAARRGSRQRLTVAGPCRCRTCFPNRAGVGLSQTSARVAREQGLSIEGRSTPRSRSSARGAFGRKGRSRYNGGDRKLP